MASVVRDWRIELMRAHPRIFRGHKAVRGYPECGEGCCDLLDRACVRIEAALAGDGIFTALQIKEKYGTCVSTGAAPPQGGRSDG